MTEKAPTRKQRGPTNRTDRAREAAKETFVKVLAETCNVSEACRQAGIARSTAHDWREADADFAKGWEDAIQIAKDAVKGEAHRRGVVGWDEPVFHQGKQVAIVRRYSDRMLEILLKGHHPEFRERGPDVNILNAPAAPLSQVDLLATARRLAVLFRRVRSDMEAQELRERLLPAHVVNPAEGGEK